MSKYSFARRNSLDMLLEFLNKYDEYMEDDTSSSKAIDLSTTAWHMIEWVFNEYPELHGKSDIGGFRETLYGKCPFLRVLHDIVNGSKHFHLSRPKTKIKETRKIKGAFSSDFNNDFDIDRLEIEMEDGSILYFLDEITSVRIFWIDYFEHDLGIKLG